MTETLTPPLEKVQDILSESHKPHEPRSLQIEKANPTLNFNAAFYVLLYALHDIFLLNPCYFVR